MAKGARKPGGRLAAVASSFAPLICCSRMVARSTWFLRRSLWRRRSVPLLTTRRPVPLARLPRLRARARSRMPRIHLPLPSRSERSRLSAAVSTRHIWTCSWRPLSLNCCRTLATDPIFRHACCAETPCCRIFRPRRAGFCAGRAPRACLGAELVSTGEVVWLRALMSMTFDALMAERIDPHTAAFLLGLSHVWAATHTDQRLRAMEFMLGR